MKEIMGKEKSEHWRKIMNGHQGRYDNEDEKFENFEEFGWEAADFEGVESLECFIGQFGKEGLYCNSDIYKKYLSSRVRVPLVQLSVVIH